ncbi:hypothetical protein KR222_008468, partial [Zaprionus bogoriensis]
MSVKPTLKLGCNRMLTRHWPLARLSMLGTNPTRGRRRRHAGTPRMSNGGVPIKWFLHLDIERPIEDRSVSMPWLLYLYSPWKMLLNKLSVWKFMLICDWNFSEKQFLDNSRQALALLTKFIAGGQRQCIQSCTTPMGYKQVMHDLGECQANQHKLLQFEKRHICRAIPLQVKYLPHYDHNFAFVDVIFLASRSSDDFGSKKQVREIRKLIRLHADCYKLQTPNPIVYAELFVRFRRDYSLPATVRAGHWLVSTFKVLKLDVLNELPDFY